MTAIDKIARYIFLVVLWMTAFVVAGQTLFLGDANELMSIGLFIAAGGLSSQATWRPTDTLDKLARYGFLIGLWGVTSLFTMFVMSRSDFLSLTLLTAIIAALATSSNMFPQYADEAPAEKRPKTTSTPEKSKNDQINRLSPLEILSPDDLYELRQEIKDELRTRILSGSDGELSSLDALLAGQDTPRKTTKK